MRLQRHGIEVSVPHGWETRIYRRDDDAPGSTTHAVMHAATFALPQQRGDFGTGAVEIMRDNDVFVVLFEYHPDAAATPLFAASGLPRALDPQAFAPNQLQRTLRGQSGVQRFFHVEGRAFCLYVVLGSHARRAQLVPRVHRLLAGLQVLPAGGG